MSHVSLGAVAPSIACCLSLSAAFAQAGQPGPLRVGIASADITPEGPVWMYGFGGRDNVKPSEGTAQELVAQCVLFDNGQTRVAFVALDLCVVSYYQTLKLRAAAEAAGVPQQHLMVNVSHTHFGPHLGQHHPDNRNLEYETLLTERLQGLFPAAAADLKPALLDYTVGSCDMGFNRRSCYAPGGRKPNDPDVPVLRVVSPEGKVRALLFGYACHPTTAGGSMLYVIGSDYPGYTRQWVAAGYPDAEAIFLQACGADVKPGNCGNPSSVWHTGFLNPNQAKQMMGYELGRAVIKAVAGHGSSHPASPPLPPIAPLADGRLPTERERGFPVPPPPVPADRAADVEQALATPVTLGGMVETVSLPSKADPERSWQNPWHMGAWRIGDVYFWGSQGEVLSAFGRRIKSELPEVRVWTSGYTHWGGGYVPEAATYPEGGYEVDITAFAPQAEEIIVANAHRYLKELQTEPIHTAPIPRCHP
ncbi:MAG: hypothetical protein HY321_03985 [Armatimonadetes bacterium]|nr:hypothetical protein [Armatimonadota bacterium]